MSHNVWSSFNSPKLKLENCYKKSEVKYFCTKLENVPLKGMYLKLYFWSLHLCCMRIFTFSVYRLQDSDNFSVSFLAQLIVNHMLLEAPNLISKPTVFKHIFLFFLPLCRRIQLLKNYQQYFSPDLSNNYKNLFETYS